ncbi:hypothetical protein D5F01_LYC23797 [Larimichthys crocea]|uniref:Uncharacterized protein n=1 Tax=Larimichthys crocea TaxID=215358 RepID=A0A6G0HFZ4_LARCR|nr:hypothetical protein D5F01_LYC23797 [Larimichthys crocea]
MMETTFRIFVIRKEGAEPDVAPEDVGIVLEGVQVLDELGNVPLAVVMLFALVYALNLSYPPELRYTLEALQKIIMELDGNRLSKKNQTLKTLLARDALDIDDTSLSSSTEDENETVIKEMMQHVENDTASALMDDVDHEEEVSNDDGDDDEEVSAKAMGPPCNSKFCQRVSTRDCQVLTKEQR